MRGEKGQSGILIANLLVHGHRQCGGTNATLFLWAEKIVRKGGMTMRTFLMGCAIGAVLGLLFAPKRGEETRAEVQRWFDDWQSQAQDRLTDVRDRATTVIEQGRLGVNTALDKVQEATNQVAQKAKEQVNSVG